jgi:cytochrome c biogenesis protein CcmG, thiol:disulfide interchange protein DsbE
LKRALFLSVPLILVIALFGVFATQITNNTKFLPSVLINKPVPEFSLPPIEGIENEIGDIPGFSTEDLKGQVSVVNVFASWCIPCRQEHPLFTRLGEEQPEIFLAGINQKDAPENAIAFLQELGNPYDAIGADFKGRTSIEWGVYGVPETFVVNAEGIITYKFIGGLTGTTFRESLMPAIEAAKAQSGEAQSSGQQPAQSNS